MPSMALYQLNRVYNLADFGARGNSGGDDGIAINSAIEQLYDASDPVALYLPTGIYRIARALLIPSNFTLFGAGRSTVLQLAPSTVLTSVPSALLRNYDWDNGNSQIRIANLRIDGNRANQANGTPSGLLFRNVTEYWLENVEIISCRGHGFDLQVCEYGELRGCRAYDNGEHGFSLVTCKRHLLMAPRAIDNCQVATAGTRDGINLDVLSESNTIVAPVCEDTVGSGTYQGYGVRETAGGGCSRNLILGGDLASNLSGAVSLDSGDSLALVPGAITLPGGLTITA